MANIYQTSVKPKVFEDFEKGLRRADVSAKHNIGWTTADRWYKEWQLKKKVAA